MHHIISDAWTMLLVANQLLGIINGEKPAAYDFVEIMSNSDNYETTKRYLKDVDELFETIISVLAEGTADDSRSIGSLHR